MKPIEKAILEVFLPKWKKNLTMNEYPNNKRAQLRKYFKRIEYSMGNGQCPECDGLDPNKAWLTILSTGHSTDCELAKCMTVVGSNPKYIDISS